MAHKGSLVSDYNLIEGSKGKEQQVGDVNVRGQDSNESSVFTEKVVDYIMSRKL
jgi:hypothetical protein